MTNAALVGLVARAISPYAWDNVYWGSEARTDQYDRNQRHAQRHAQAVARRQALDAIEALRRHGVLLVRPAP